MAQDIPAGDAATGPPGLSGVVGRLLAWRWVDRAGAGPVAWTAPTGAARTPACTDPYEEPTPAGNEAT